MVMRREEQRGRRCFVEERGGVGKGLSVFFQHTSLLHVRSYIILFFNLSNNTHDLIGTFNNSFPLNTIPRLLIKFIEPTYHRRLHSLSFSMPVCSCACQLSGRGREENDGWIAIGYDRVSGKKG